MPCKGFLRAFMKGLKETVKQPAMRNRVGAQAQCQTAKKNVELERLTMAIRDNIVTPEVKETAMAKSTTPASPSALEQIALTYKFKAAKPKLEDIFDSSFLPPAAGP